MGIFHIAGLGLSPGAVTVPITYHVERLLRQIETGKKDPFFQRSGERSGQDLSVNLEGLILITTPQILQGDQESSTKKEIVYNEPWSEEGKKTLPPGDNPFKITVKYFSTLIQQIYEATDKQHHVDLFVVKIPRGNDFWDTFIKLSCVFSCLKGTGNLGKETWINLTGGDNQVQHALLVASSFHQSYSRVFYYATKQENEKFLSPIGEFDKKKPIDPVPNPWVDLPIITVQMCIIHEKILLKIAENSPRQTNINELKAIYWDNDILSTMRRFHHQGFVYMDNVDYYSLTDTGLKMVDLIQKKSQWLEKRHGGLNLLAKDVEMSEWFAKCALDDE